MRTEVSITVDTEFSIAGAFEDFERYKPIAENVVECAVDGKGEGIGFMLETFEKFGTPATFFVEALNHRYFGDAPMAAVCRRLAQHGSDIQLHFHPCWMSFENGARLPGAPDDSSAGRSFEDLKAIVQVGLDAFNRWGVPRPVALRTGSLEADRTVYAVLAALGIPLASCIGLGVYRPAAPELRLANGRHRIHGVTELPVTSYRSLGGGIGRLRTLTISGCGAAEMRSVLWSARRAGLQNVVVLTHPFEFVKASSFRYERLTRNRVNQNRLASLCAFLREHDQDFVPVSFGGQAEAWSARPATEQVALGAAPALTVMWMAENALNDRIWAY